MGFQEMLTLLRTFISRIQHLEYEIAIYQEREKQAQAAQAKLDLQLPDPIQSNGEEVTHAVQHSGS